MSIAKTAALFAALSVLASFAFAEERLRLPGLQAEVKLVRERSGVAHIYARNDHDVYFTHGYLHALDRFFQMDASRRQASGTLAELLGPGPGNQVLAGDVQLRTLGLRRAAVRSRGAYPADIIAVLQAYADGVNAFLETKPLPPEYAALELTRAGVPPWTVDDTIVVAKLLAFGLSFDTADTSNSVALGTYRAVGQVAGFDGTKLFFDDLFRSAPFDPAISIPEGVVSGSSPRRHGHDQRIDVDAVEKAQRFLQRPQGVPFFAPEGRGEGGSNWWVIAGSKTDSRNPMLASDPHLSLSSPSVFHEVHLNVRRSPGQEPLNVYGVGFPGVPGVVHGFNDRIMWGSTVNPMDVTDYYQERIVVDSLGGLNTFFRGALEPIVVIPETYRLNAIGDGVPNTIVVVPAGVPAATLVVPRRNNGPLVTAPSGSPLGAISVQYTGFGATREVETFAALRSRAAAWRSSSAALQFFDVGSQNWAYADIDGNIAYFTSAELPLREDLQAGTVDGGLAAVLRARRHRHAAPRMDPAGDPQPDQASRTRSCRSPRCRSSSIPRAATSRTRTTTRSARRLDNDPLNQLRAGRRHLLPQSRATHRQSARDASAPAPRELGGGGAAAVARRHGAHPGRRHDRSTPRC